MLSSRIHLAAALAALLPLAGSIPGSPLPAVAAFLFELASPAQLQLQGPNAARPEPIEIEPVGFTVNGGVAGSGD